jgi:hypothetical protein
MKSKLTKTAGLLVALVLLVGCSAKVLDPLGRPLKTHKVHFTESAIKIDGKLDEDAWKAATDVGEFQFTWGFEGEQEGTEAKLLWDNDYLYVSFVCEDAHIWAVHTERDSQVYRDDCVEVFTSPNPDTLEQYFNIEMNVNAASLEFFHPEGPGSKEPWDPDVRIATTVEGSLNDDSDSDLRWILEVAIPFSVFSDVAKNTPPNAGDEWRLNLNRLGGNIHSNRSQWSAGDPDNPGFHAPHYFGRVTFVR